MGSVLVGRQSAVFWPTKLVQAPLPYGSPHSTLYSSSWSLSTCLGFHVCTLVCICGPQNPTAKAALTQWPHTLYYRMYFMLQHWLPLASHHGGVVCMASHHGGVVCILGSGVSVSSDGITICHCTGKRAWPALASRNGRYRPHRHARKPPVLAVGPLSQHMSEMWCVKADGGRATFACFDLPTITTVHPTTCAATHADTPDAMQL